MNSQVGNFAKAFHLAAAAIISPVAICPPALATPASNFSPIQQDRGAFDALDVKGKSGHWDLKISTKETSDVYVVRNAVQPGGHSGWHSHPGPSLITVTAGSITAYHSDDPLCSPRVYNVGEGFVDTGSHAHILRNETASYAETVAVQFLPQGSGRRNDEPSPSTCNF